MDISLYILANAGKELSIESIIAAYKKSNKEVSRRTIYNSYSICCSLNYFYQYCFKDSTKRHGLILVHGLVYYIYDKNQKIEGEPYMSQSDYSNLCKMFRKPNTWNLYERNAKDLLNKNGLDKLADQIEDIDELNILANEPSEIYDGLPMEVLRSINCHYGSALVNSKYNRLFLKKLYEKYPLLFPDKINSTQCIYLEHMINVNLSVDEVERLFSSKNVEFSKSFNCNILMDDESFMRKFTLICNELAAVDPIYEEFILTASFEEYSDVIARLGVYLLRERKQYDEAIRISNKKRSPEWQECSQDYCVRYPQDINDFCREAIYSQDILLYYVNSIIRNETDILFIRKTKDMDRPFIALEIENNCFRQAFHRFERECNPEEVMWIRNYCDRHMIAYDPGKIFGREFV